MAKRPLLLFSIIAALAASAWPGAVSAQGGDIWRAKSSGSFVTLRYGPLNEREKPVFLLSCLNGVSIAVLSVYMDFPERQSGDPIPIELSAGNQSTTVAAESAQEDGTGIIYAEAGDIAVKPILKVLREKGPVAMKSEAIGEHLSDAGRAEAVAEFSNDCKLD